MLARVLLLSFLLIFTEKMLAAVFMDNYRAELTVADAGEATRQTAFTDGLRSVVTQLMESGAIEPTAKIDDLYAQANQYVERYSYTTEGEQAGDQPSLRLNMIFDANALNQFFTQQGLLQWYQFDLRVSGVASLAAYEAMMQNLQHVDGTQSVIIKKIAGNTLVITLTALKDQATWAQIMSAGGHFSLLSEDSRGLSLQWKN